MLTSCKLTGNPEAISAYHTKEENYYFAQAGGVEELAADESQASTTPTLDGGAAQSHILIHGKLAEDLGFFPGQAISEVAFTNLLAGKDASGNKVTREHKVNGIDLTFSAPKSVSVAGLLTIRDPKIIAAHDQAVLETMRELELNCAGTKPRPDAQAMTGNMAYVTIRDGFNRDHEPHLHTHVVVANMTAYRGKIMALDGQRIMARDFNKLWGAMYRFKLAVHLNELGYSVSSTKKGELRLDAVSLEVEREFSGRRAQIEAARSNGARDMAAWRSTRKAKDPSIERTDVLAGWRERAGKYQVKSAEENHRAAVIEREAWYKAAKWSVEARQELAGERTSSEVGRWQVAARRATEKSACVSSQALITEYLTELGRDEAWGSLSYHQAELRLQEQVIGGNILQTEDGRYTTWELARADRECVKDRKEAVLLALPAAKAQVEAYCSARREKGERCLSDLQAVAAEGVLSSTSATVVVQGDAGSGKTTMLKAVEEIGRAAGWEIVGVAVQGSAARKLEEESGIGSMTLSSYLAQERVAEKRSPRLVVIDEASMLDSRGLAELLSHAERHGDKVVLVGDRNQIQSVGAGRPFDRLVDAAGASGRLLNLSENYRQRNKELLEAVDLARDGRMRESFDILNKAGKVSQIEDAYLRRAQVAKHYDKDTLILTGSREGRDALNALIREERLRKGELAAGDGRSYTLCWADEDGVKYPITRELAVGDRVTLLENEYKRYDIRNGETGTVKRTDKEMLGVRLEGGREIEIELSRYNALEYGYALTTYKSQGQTYDKVVVEADTRNAQLQDQRNSYVQITRARDDVRVFTDDETELRDLAGVLSMKQDTLDLKKSLAEATLMELRLREKTLGQRARSEAAAKIAQAESTAKRDAENAAGKSISVPDTVASSIGDRHFPAPAWVKGNLNVYNKQFIASANENNHDARVGLMLEIKTTLESRQDLSDGEKGWVAEYLNSPEAAKTLERFNDPRELIAVGLVKSRAMDLEEATKDLPPNNKMAVTIHIRNQEIEKEIALKNYLGLQMVRPAAETLAATAKPMEVPVEIKNKSLLEAAGSSVKMQSRAEELCSELARHINERELPEHVKRGLEEFFRRPEAVSLIVSAKSLDTRIATAELAIGARSEEEACRGLNARERRSAVFEAERLRAGDHQKQNDISRDLGRERRRDRGLDFSL